MPCLAVGTVSLLIRKMTIGNLQINLSWWFFHGRTPRTRPVDAVIGAAEKETMFIKGPQ